MYLRETERKNKDGQRGALPVVGAQLPEPETGRSTPEIIHNFGREENVDEDGLRRLG